jgi:hypothetical protein
MRAYLDDAPHFALFEWSESDLSMVQACHSGVHYSAATLHKVAGWGDVAANIQRMANVCDPDSAHVPTVNVPQVLVVGVVQQPEEDAFPGLFSPTLSATLLPARPFLGAVPKKLLPLSCRM